MSHLDGMNALPRWDPNDLGKGYTKPTDWRDYDPADYKTFADARAAADKERFAKAQAELKQTMKDVSKSIKDKINSEMQKAGLLDTPDDSTDDTPEILSIDKPSTCFASVEWSPVEPDGEDGFVTGEFWRGGALVYSGPMTRTEFEEWQSASEGDEGSTGKFYNSSVDAF